MSVAKTQILAAIDVGSNSIRMKIVEVKSGGKVIPLEDLRRAINLGRDSFAHGFVKTETIQSACNILKDFRKLMKEYKIKAYKAVCTSAVREASNRDYILEQIKTKTGLNIDVINNSQERFLTYKAIRDKMENYSNLRKEGILIVDIGSGGVEVSVYKDGYLRFSENIKVGSLRLREILQDLERKTLNFSDIMKEFVESKIYLLKPVIREMNIKNFIGVGGELRIISILCNNSMDELVKIQKADLTTLHEDIKKLTTQNIVHKFGIATDRADILLPSIILFREFLQITDSEHIYAPLVSLRDGIISDMVDQRHKPKRRKEYIEDIIYSVRTLGKKYQYDEAHANQVEKLSMALFHGTKRLHGLGEKEAFYLQMAAILHDIGKFISLNEHHINTYNIIMQSHIIGLSNEDLTIIAHVARYHSEENVIITEENYRNLKYKNRMMISKLSAILKLADTLDLSHKQSIKDIQITMDREMTVKVEAEGDITLEQWSFEHKSDFFEEVFGIKPVLKKKGR